MVTDCPRIIDGICRANYASAAYHRLVDCLLPMYAGLHDALRREHGACLLLHPPAFFELLPLLAPASETPALVNQTRAAELRAVRRFVPVTRHRPPDLRTTALLQQHVAAHLAGAEAQASSSMLLVVRRRPADRVFEGDWHVLAHRLSVASGRPVVAYTGAEPLLQTVGLFASARVVVGYHGAGLANAVFMPPRGCVIEVSTYMAEPDQLSPTSRANLSKAAGHYIDHDGHKWRTNEPGILPWNPTLAWSVYRVPLAQILAANQRTSATWRWRRYPDALKFLPWLQALDDAPASAGAEQRADDEALAQEAALLAATAARGATGPMDAPAALLRAARLVRTHAFEVRSAGHARHGLAIYAVGSLANHSCAPTALASFGEGAGGGCATLRLHALAPLCAGDEVTISYVDAYQSHGRRRRQLRRAGFDCGCARCARRAPEALAAERCTRCGAPRAARRAARCARCRARGDGEAAARARRALRRAVRLFARCGGMGADADADVAAAADARRLRRAVCLLLRLARAPRRVAAATARGARRRGGALGGHAALGAHHELRYEAALALVAVAAAAGCSHAEAVARRVVAAARARADRAAF